MKAHTRKEISNILVKTKSMPMFLDRLEGWIGELNHPASFYRKPEIVKPRSKKALKSIQEARKAGDRFAQKIESIVQLPAYRYPAERWSLTQMSDALEKFDDFLAGLALRMGPSTSEETNKRLYRERYALRGLMWLFSRYFPAKKISSAPNSHFYRVAQCMFEEIEYDRQDYRQLIEEEKRLFLKEREEGSISVEGDLMMFVMNI